MSNLRNKSENLKAGRKTQQEPANDAESDANANATLHAVTLQAMIDTLKTDIFGKIDSLTSKLQSEIVSVRQELKNSIGPIQEKVDKLLMSKKLETWNRSNGPRRPTGRIAD